MPHRVSIAGVQFINLVANVGCDVNCRSENIIFSRSISPLLSFLVKPYQNVGCLSVRRLFYDHLISLRNYWMITDEYKETTIPKNYIIRC